MQNKIRQDFFIGQWHETSRSIRFNGDWQQPQSSPGYNRIGWNFVNDHQIEIMYDDHVRYVKLYVFWEIQSPKSYLRIIDENQQDDDMCGITETRRYVIDIIDDNTIEVRMWNLDGLVADIMIVFTRPRN